MIFQDLYPYISTVIASWVASALAAPKIFDHYLSAKAAQKLEDFKSRIGQWTDRRTRSNDNEYKAAIDCWKELYSAFVEVDTMHGIKPALFLANIKDDQREIILKSCGYNKDEISRILSNSDSQNELRTVRAEKEIIESIDKLNIAKKTVEENSIFLSDEIYENISETIAVMRISVFLFGNENLYSHTIPGQETSSQAYERSKKMIDKIRLDLRESLLIHPIREGR